ncbi:oxygenase MpaB family protein [Telluribacter sp. SYSU D00476]|uniref:oxygenase MpaB family protein n=1 Tax=Telluribacter sp. SYSU D00476 TaxID=2811430 RepID=UPI001FF18858|nr:oxygenase MpaB family protein [Telluribacter sp. SYSU D00476]
MNYFVRKDSIVREIWGKGDTILFIFAGASAEFALNKAVDWLYFTGKLPADPLGRLFSTVAYARQIVFSELDAANKAIDRIAAIHAGVEAKRGATIPDWAYRDVLFMLIDYSIRSYELLERKLTQAEKEEVFDVFFRVGTRMGLVGLPMTFADWLVMREQHLEQNMVNSHFTKDLYKQYRKHLGLIRYKLLMEAQVMVVPARVNTLLSLGNLPLLDPVLTVYKWSRKLKTDWILKSLILPDQYKAEIKQLDVYRA